MKSAFISHSWHDKPLAKKIAGVLHRLGGRVWLDDAEIKLGDSLIEKIRKGIDSVDFVIALISDKSVSSAWVTRELDIAMNQEIAGRHVKVLPILASKCALPGFLTGKLYADMSSPKTFQKSLPALLDRLDAPADAVSRARVGKSIKKEDDAGWLANLSKALESGDPLTQYRGLRAAPTHKAMALLTDSAALDAVFALLGGATPPHVKIRALELLRGIEDDAFAYRMEPLLSDSDPHVVSAAIESLAELDASASAPRVLDLLNVSPDSQTRTDCLQFFSKVRLNGDVTTLSLLSICDRLSAEFPNDEGLKLAIARALLNQLTNRAAATEVLPRVLVALLSSTKAICLGVLDKICEFGEDFYIPYLPNLRSSLADAIRKCGERDDPAIAAAAWTACLLVPVLFKDSSNREVLWQLVNRGDEMAIECWLERLDEYRLEVVFDDPGDAGQLGGLVGKFNNSVDEKLCAALCEIQSDIALQFLSRTKYEPKGWNKIAVLRNIARLRFWAPDLRALLLTSLQDLPDYTGEVGKAWALLAQQKAGIIDLTLLIDGFPKVQGNFSYFERDVAQVSAVLSKLHESATSKTRRKLKQIIDGMSD